MTDLDLWEMAKENLHKGEAADSLACLRKLGRSARALYNRAMLSDNDEEALTLMQECVECDSYLAIGHFRWAQLQDESFNRPAEAVKHYRSCLASFREASFIDYTQLGMPLRLSYSSVLYNLGLVQLAGVDRGAGLRSLVTAHHQCEDAVERERIEAAIANLGADAEPYRSAKDLLFWPISARQSPTVNLDPLIFDDPQAAFDSIHRRQSSVASIMSQAKRTVVDDSWVPVSRGSPSVHSQRSSLSACDSEGLLVKVAYTDGPVFERPVYRVFKLESLDLGELEASLSLRFRHQRLRIKYRDEQDWIVLVDEDDIRMALESDTSLLRLWCYPK